MKALTIAAISILASVQICSADLFQNFFGTWTQDGVAPGTKITTVYKRFEKKGLVATTTIVIPDQDKGVGVTRYYDNGKIKGDFKRNGAVQSKLSGTWSVSKMSLKANLKVSAPMVPVFTGVIKTTLVSNTKIKTVSVAEDGARSSSSLIRKK